MSESEENELSLNRNILPLILGAVSAVFMIAGLFVQGRVWWCKSGDHAVYINESASSHTSQHFFDPYSFTHMGHGILFYWMACLIFPKLTIQWKFFVTMAVEAVWEIFENSAYVIEKYRANTVSLDYVGDSIANSSGDFAACAAGFLIAYKIGWRFSIAFFLVVELILTLWIRDSLLLNIVMLVVPLDAVKEWQLNV